MNKTPLRPELELDGSCRKFLQLMFAAQGWSWFPWGRSTMETEAAGRGHTQQDAALRLSVTATLVGGTEAAGRRGPPGATGGRRGKVQF